MTPLDKARRANCEIWSEKGHGNGTLIAPGLVLAAWHTLHDAGQLTFVNTSGGMREEASKGHVVDESLDDDLILFQLDKPIGLYVAAAVKQERAVYESMQQTLLTCFNGIAAEYSVTKLFGTTTFKGQPRTAFSSNGIRCFGDGYSGSPVVNGAGQIISMILSGREGEDVPFDEFLGPQPKRLAAFMEQAKLKL